MTAADVDRRKDDRIRCRIACDVGHGGKTVEGLIRNVSRGGLSLQTSVPLEQGAGVQLMITRSRKRPEVSLHAIVWYHRALRNRQSGKIIQILGLVLSDAPESFIDLLESLRPVATPVQQRYAAKHGGKEKKQKTEQPKPPKVDSKAGGEPDAVCPATAPSSNKPEQLALPKPKRFQVRVKMIAQSRTRSIMVFADSTDEAHDLALSEAGEDWMVLSVDARD